MPEQALLRLQELSFEGAGSYREVVDPLPLAGQGAVLLCGAEGCLAASTHIPYDVQNERGERRNSKGGTIERLYHRFHGIDPPSGKGQYLRGLDNAQFFVSSVNDEGRILKNRIVDVVKTGTRPCFRVETALGFVVVATADHKFWIGSRYVPTSALRVGSHVYVHNNTRYTKQDKTRQARPAVCVKHHPHGSVKDVFDKKTGNTYSYKRLPRSHLAVEAHMNGLSYKEYRKRLNDGDLDGLQFLGHDVHVHHVDENFRNDDPANLMVLDPKDHNRQHAIEQHNNLRFVAVRDTIVSITPVGERETYDIKVQGPFNNYVANGFVVHNSGKSMVPEVMTLVLYGKGSPRVRKTGLVESSIVNEAVGYCGTLGFISGHGAAEREVIITQAFKHKRLKSRYIIEIDGMREEPDTKPEQKKLVKRLAPLSYDEWLGVVYLHQGGIHDLLAGTPTEKRQYLTSVFGLDFYDDLLTEAKEEAKRLTKLTVGAEVLQQKLVDLEDEIREQESILDKVPGGLDAINERIEKLTRRMRSQAKKIGKLDAAITAVDKLKSLTVEGEALADYLKVSGKDETEDALNLADTQRQTLVQSVAEDEATLKSMEGKASAYKKAKRENEDTKLKLDSAKEAFADLEALTLHHPPLDLVDVALGIAAEAVTLLGDDMTIDIPEGVDEADRDWQLLAKEAHSREVTADKLEKLAKRGTHTCPTCNADLDRKTVEHTVETLRHLAGDERLSAADAMLADVAEHLGDWQPEVEELDIGCLKEALEDATQMIKDRDAADANVERLAKEHTRARENFEALPRPKNPKKLADELVVKRDELAALDEWIADLRRAMTIHEQFAALEETLDGVDIDRVEGEWQELTRQSEDTHARYKKTMAIKSRHDQATATLRSLRKQIDEVHEKLDEHADNALKIKHYDLTLVPYFETLRAAKVRSSVSVLEGVLPVYVNAMADSQYAGAEVKLSITEDLKKVDLMLRTGKHTPWISALQASGGQRRRFTLAIIAALREVSPRRANLMFFDEPFADLESEGKLLFINKLVPLLMDRCDDLDSLFVIAHDREILEASNDAFDSVWQAERHPGRGSVITTDHRLARVAGR